MKKKYILIVAAILGTTTMFAQNFGVSVDYAMWNGRFIDYTQAGELAPKIENTESTSSVILGVNYSHNLSEKLNVIGSAGYGLSFKVIPLKANFNYEITDKISGNLGMGIYMISDSTYTAKLKGVLDEESGTRSEPSKNEFGINLGVSYQVTSSIALGVNYNALKDGDFDFNGMSFGLSYAFGGKLKDKTALKKPVSSKEPVASTQLVASKQQLADSKQPVAPNNDSDMQKKIKEANELLEELEQAQSELLSKNNELNRLSYSLNAKDKELKLVRQELEERSERVIELEMKEYLGVQLPVFNTYSFGSAFNSAVAKYGSSKEQMFWWGGSVYTTERR